MAAPLVGENASREVYTLSDRLGSRDQRFALCSSLVDVNLVAQFVGLQQHGLLYVGDCKLAAMQTRASIQAQEDFYLCPLSAVQLPPEQLARVVEEQRHRGADLVQVVRTDEHGENICITQGYETVQQLSALVDGHQETWEKRRLLVQSMAATHAAQASLQERLHKAQHALQELTARRQGKARLTERPAIEEAIKEVLTRFRVEGLLRVQIQEHMQQRPVRAYRGRLLTMRREVTFTVSSEREEEAIAQTMSELGWPLTLEQAVEAYRDEYLVERNFARLKGRPLSLAPLYVQRDDHRVGCGSLAHHRLACHDSAGRGASATSA